MNRSRNPVRVARLQHDLSQAQLADRLNAISEGASSQRRISSLELNPDWILLKEAILVAITCEIPLSNLLIEPDRALYLGMTMGDRLPEIKAIGDSWTDFVTAKIKQGRQSRFSTQMACARYLAGIGLRFSQRKLNHLERGLQDCRLVDAFKLAIAFEQPLEFFVHPQDREKLYGKKIS
jgi:transcriptional regulator with XRE-family HTH domain